MNWIPGYRPTAGEIVDYFEGCQVLRLKLFVLRVTKNRDHGFNVVRRINSRIRPSLKLPCNHSFRVKGGRK